MHLFHHPQVLTSEQQHARMLQTPVPRLILSLCGPTVLSQLVSVIYNTADTYFVSQLSTSASAAVGVVFSLMSIIQSVGYGLSMGSSSLISLRLGEKKNEEAGTYAISACFAAVLLGALIGAVGLWNLEPLMRLLGATKTMLPHCCDYAQYILLGAPIMCASFVMNGILRAQGEADLAMWGLCSGSVLNIILDPIFIFVLDLKTAGAALATLAGQVVSFAVLLSAFLRGKSIIHLRLRAISRDLRIYWQMILTGFPTICRQGLASFASAQLNIHAAVYGDAAVAAVTIANKVYLLVRNIIIGIGQGFLPVAGYNYGAGDKRRTKQAFLFTCMLGSAVCATAAVVIAIFAPQIIGWFRDDPQVILIGRQALLFACAVMPVMAYSTYVNQLYQALGFKLPATLLAACRQGFCYLPLIWFLPPLIGITGVQLAQPGADFLTFLISIPAHIYFFRKHLKM